MSLQLAITIWKQGRHHLFSFSHVVLFHIMYLAFGISILFLASSSSTLQQNGLSPLLIQHLLSHQDVSSVVEHTNWWQFTSFAFLLLFSPQHYKRSFHQGKKSTMAGVQNPLIRFKIGIKFLKNNRKCLFSGLHLNQSSSRGYNHIRWQLRL